MISVSVIVPVYNVEDFIARCAQSLLAQLIPDIEIIFVNDCCTDSTMQILSEVLRSHSLTSPYVRIIHHNQRQGPHLARLTGLKVARGNYIGFCDADDWVEPQMYEQLLRDAVALNADLAVCDYLWEYADHTEPWHYRYDTSPQRCLQHASDPHCFSGLMWTHLIRRELVLTSMMQVVPVFYGEDLYTMIYAYYHADRVAHVSIPLYHYNRCNPSGLMSQSVRPKNSWEGQRRNIDSIVCLLDPIHHPEYHLTCQWIKFKVKEKFLSAFSSLYSFYKEYCECYSDIARFAYLPKSIRYKLLFIYSSYPVFWLYHHLIYYYKAKDLLLRFVYYKPRIMSIEATVQFINDRHCSLSRFGDGELKVMYGGDINFQPSSELLRSRLREVFSTHHPQLLLGIPDVFSHLERYTSSEQHFWRWHLVANRSRWYAHLSRDTIYASTFISRFYSPSFNTFVASKQLSLLRELWNQRNIIIVEGIHSKLGVGNDLFNNSCSIRRILCPSRNAFAQYDAIISAALASIVSDDTLFIIALGPTATVLAYDLSCHGYQALDLGHIDIEYEWFLHGVTSKEPVLGKFCNEAYLEHKSSHEVVGHLEDATYQSQIITIIGK